MNLSKKTGIAIASIGINTGTQAGMEEYKIVQRFTERVASGVDRTNFTRATIRLIIKDQLEFEKGEN